MRPVALSQVAAWVEGRHLGAEADVSSVSIDSRTVAPGALFVALRGERHDGHAHVAQAAERGAAAVLVHRPVDVDLPQVLCADTEEALGELAAGLQQGRPAVVVALTGSNGKTSVKTLALSILSRAGHAYANPGNRNNQIGLPLAVIDAPEDARFAIYEMGAGQPGDIAYLASVVTPNVALVNNIMPAHLERMGSLLGIAETKGAIYEALPDDGVAVVNADDAFAPYFMQRIGRRRVLRFGLENDADLRASALRAGAEGVAFRLHTPAGDADVALPLQGRHNVMNALAAAGLALGAGASLRDVVDGLQGAPAVSCSSTTATTPTPGRWPRRSPRWPPAAARPGWCWATCWNWAKPRPRCTRKPATAPAARAWRDCGPPARSAPMRPAPSATAPAISRTRRR